MGTHNICRYKEVDKKYTGSQILGVSRAFLQLVEWMVQIEPLDFFLFIFFLS